MTCPTCKGFCCGFTVVEITRPLRLWDNRGKHGHGRHVCPDCNPPTPRRFHGYRRIQKNDWWRNRALRTKVKELDIARLDKRQLRRARRKGWLK